MNDVIYHWISNTDYTDDVCQVITQGLGELRTREALEAWTSGAVSFIVAINKEDRVVGCGAIGRLFIYKQSYFLAFNSVVPEYRNQDIGNTITQKRIERIRELGGRFIFSAGKDHWKRYTKFDFKHLCELNSDDETHHLVVSGQ
jgi:N-acetylglutamate synthase-like GNAT family acetyltransferase